MDWISMLTSGLEVRWKSDHAFQFSHLLCRDSICRRRGRRRREKKEDEEKEKSRRVILWILLNNLRTVDCVASMAAKEKCNRRINELASPSARDQEVRQSNYWNNINTLWGTWCPKNSLTTFFACRVFYSQNLKMCPSLAITGNPGYATGCCRRHRPLYLIHIAPVIRVFFLFFES